MAFQQLAKPGAQPAPGDLLIACHGDQVLIDSRAPADQPSFASVERVTELCAGLPEPKPSALHLGLKDGQACWGLELPRAHTPAAPDGHTWIEARALMGLLNKEGIQLLSAARQLLFWEASHRFCGHCGHPLEDSKDERARQCPRCKKFHYPIQAPAIIVAVTRGDRILLAHNKNFRSGMNSVLAGFVDPGESLEMAVGREVMEEVGVRIKELRYVASQPWPFPNSLMLAFRAEYLDGEIQVDGKEIEYANWYSRDALPEIPKPGTIARLLIDRWLGGD